MIANRATVLQTEARSPGKQESTLIHCESTLDGVRLEAVSKAYRVGRERVEAVRAVSLTATLGEILVLAGPSGSGKTTLLRLIAGLERPDEGRIFLGNADVTAWPPHERQVAVVRQDGALYPHLSVRGNLEFPLRMRGVGRRERREQAEAAADRLGVGWLLGRSPDQLSGGERQQVALGRALIQKPGVFLLDEPLSQVDVTLRERLRQDFKALIRESGAACVYVTHDQEEAMRLADRLAIMREGRLQQEGPPREIHERPTNRFVAEFFGRPCVNVIPVTLRAEGGGFSLCLPGGSVPVAAAARDLHSGEFKCALGIRPHDVRLIREGRGGEAARVERQRNAREDGAGRLQIAGEVIDSAWLGDHVLVEVRPVGGEAWGVTLPARCGEDRGSPDPPHVGTQVTLAVDFARIMWFSVVPPFERIEAPCGPLGAYPAILGGG